mgnify:CR=1 FL=1
MRKTLLKGILYASVFLGSSIYNSSKAQGQEKIEKQEESYSVGTLVNDQVKAIEVFQTLDNKEKMKIFQIFALAYGVDSKNNEINLANHLTCSQEKSLLENNISFLKKAYNELAEKENEIEEQISNSKSLEIFVIQNADLKIMYEGKKKKAAELKTSLLEDANIQLSKRDVSYAKVAEDANKTLLGLREFLLQPKEEWNRFNDLKDEMKQGYTKSLLWAYKIIEEKDKRPKELESEQGLLRPVEFLNNPADMLGKISALNQKDSETFLQGYFTMLSWAYKAEVEKKQTTSDLLKNCSNDKSLLEKTKKDSYKDLEELASKVSELSKTSIALKSMESHIDKDKKLKKNYENFLNDLNKEKIKEEKDAKKQEKENLEKEKKEEIKKKK